ncbi:putative bifunctional diguanylate cyclase/phosphodiesterase [Consotaella salsifontis]|uniref:Diguanylate cyclase/phosphodiesterase n=1 Tax=Consotaella salsifontis TaxID=1365950 RepID=A0A1T4TEW7_9HYPH|nr:EAL domain-containing protein [Consotaella salsifontis]SKA38990.1 diguanylate cyclase/phosphodiesterase [Consotaella salsifontis]
MRHRVTLSDAGILIAVFAAAGASAFLFDASGELSFDQRVEVVELIGLGVLVFGGLALFGWRRIAEQEREIRQRIAAEDHARFLALHDHLTGLPNRRQLQQALAAAVAIPPGAERVHAIFVLDLNGFKKVNDSFGHARGDEVLSSAAKRIAGALREGDLLARTGGDEFTIVVRDIPGPEGATSIATHILQCLEAPIVIGSDHHSVGTGIGIAIIPRDGTDPAELLRKADVALYKVKASGVSGFAFFQDEMVREARERDRLQRDLSAAIGTEALFPVYQPIVCLKTGGIRGFEALARWSHPDLGSVPPDRFIPVAEDSGLIAGLTDQILRRACEDARNWPEPIGLSVNISPVLLRDEGLAERILTIVQDTGLALYRLELEITENAIVRDFEAAKDVLGALREAGIRIALDDFGTGATSLFHLRSFRFDVIKIDRSFIDRMTREQESAAIVRALLGLGKGLGLEIVAEGVEDRAQKLALQQEGCTDGQGYFFSRPVAFDETVRLLRGKHDWARDRAVA